MKYIYFYSIDLLNENNIKKGSNSNFIELHHPIESAEDYAKLLEALKEIECNETFKNIQIISFNKV